MTLESGRQAEVQDAYRAAAAAGRQSGTPEGLEIAARALLALANLLAHDPTGDAVEAAYLAAAAADRKFGGSSRSA